MNRKLNIITIALLISGYSHLSLASYGDNCENSSDRQMYLHCVSLNMPHNTHRIIQETIDSGSRMIAVCADDYYYMSQTFGAEDEPKPGTYKHPFYQCNDINCQENKLIGVDTYTVNPDKTVNPYHYSVTPDMNYGNECRDLLEGSDPFITVLGFSCNNSAYCITPTVPDNTNRYIKITNNESISMTLCANKTTRFGYSPPKDKLDPGNYNIYIYQCDNFDCKQQRLVGQDAIKLDNDGKPNHPSYSFAIDPGFGESCTPTDVSKN